jgi:hypothetical protein
VSDLDAQAAVAAAFAILQAARQTSAPQLVCARCRRAFLWEALTPITPALCRRCAAVPDGRE